jgi:IS1 family transposase
VAEAAVAAMWSYGGKQRDPRGLWHALEPPRGHVWAYGLGRRTAEGLRKRKARWDPWGITRYETDYGGASPRHLETEAHHAGQRHTQPLERKPLPWRTRSKRLVRQTSGCARSTQRHAIVLGLCVHREELGLLV